MKRMFKMAYAWAVALCVTVLGGIGAQAQLSAPANVDTNVTAVVGSVYTSLTSGDGANVITWVLVVAGGLLALGIIIGLVKRAISSVRGSA